MRYEYIEPFVDTTLKVLDKVIQCDITRGSVSLVKSQKMTKDIAIIVRLRGDSDGSIVLSMTADTALSVCNEMFGECFEELTPTGIDLIAEIANMIAGNAVSALNDMGFDFTVSLPLVVTKNHMPEKTLEVEAFQIPLFTEYGELIMNVSMRTN
jgi:chemotaxis protein CheX